MVERSFACKISRLLRSGAGQVDLAEACANAEIGAEEDVDQAMIGLRHKFGMDFDLEITVLPEILHQRVFCLTDIGGRIRHLRVVVRDLQQRGVGEFFQRAGKVVHADVDGGREDEAHLHAVGGGLQIQLDILEAALLQRGDAGIHILFT